MLTILSTHPLFKSEFHLPVPQNSCQVHPHPPTCQASSHLSASASMSWQQAHSVALTPTFLASQAACLSSLALPRSLGSARDLSSLAPTVILSRLRAFRPPLCPHPRSYLCSLLLSGWGSLHQLTSHEQPRS